MGCAKSQEEEEKTKDEEDPPMNVRFEMDRWQEVIAIDRHDPSEEWKRTRLLPALLSASVVERGQQVQAEDVIVEFANTVMAPHESLADHAVEPDALVTVRLDLERAHGYKIVEIAGRYGYFLDQVTLRTKKGDVFTQGGMGGNAWPARQVDSYVTGIWYSGHHEYEGKGIRFILSDGKHMEVVGCKCNDWTTKIEARPGHHLTCQCPPNATHEFQFGNRNQFHFYELPIPSDVA
eukprot:TRINITY_DN4929_c0_g4_i1.p1 TRINITY_DN4929_c0_g4~~TRINITY_DN4929_c0_g4_i1.p1  ORF type:complete len:235 (-),score=31.69 TRINITY_DN4929_c0_g4_i1:20-724(-)